MRIGSRIVLPEEVGRWEMDLVQISVYRGMERNMAHMEACARRCRAAGVPYAIHPVGFSPLDPAAFEALQRMVDWTDESLILHDERARDGGRLSGEEGARFRGACRVLSSSAPLSFENAVDSRDILWFWREYASSITLDIGHLEVAGMDSVSFIETLPDEELNKIAYVHVHRNGEYRNGLTDHWFLTPGCRELSALDALLRRRRDVSVLLEINEVEMIGHSLALLRTLGARHGHAPP